MANESCTIYFYEPTFAGATTFVPLYTLPTIFLCYLTIRYKSWYFLCVPLGGLLETIGYAQRINSVKHVCDIGAFASSQSLIVIAPLFIAAGNYLLMGRLILSVLPTHSHKLLGVSATKITKVFVGADVFSFLIQVSGSGIASADNWNGKMGRIGIHVLIAGLSAQLATIVFFIAIALTFSKRAMRDGQIKDSAPDGWRKVLTTVLSSCILITVRSIYRLVEFALGVGGYPVTHEWTFYILEAVPMLPALAVFCLWFPPRFLPKERYSAEAVVTYVEHENKPGSAQK